MLTDLPVLHLLGPGNVLLDAESGSGRVTEPARDLPEASGSQRPEGELVDAVAVEADVGARRRRPSFCRTLAQLPQQRQRRHRGRIFATRSQPG